MNTKVVIITGASRGLGKALAIGLSRAGFIIAASGRNITDLEQLKTRLTGDYLIHKCDITNWEDCQKLVEAVVSKYGWIDVLINNAGGKYVKTSLLDSTKEDVDSVFDTQVKGTTYITKAVLAQMAKQKAGKIYTITYSPYRLGLDLLDTQKPKTLHIASLFGKAAIADVVAIEAKNYGVRSIPVFIRWVASDLDIDEPLDPREKSNHPKEVVEAIRENILSEEDTKEIMISPHNG